MELRQLGLSDDLRGVESDREVGGIVECGVSAIWLARSSGPLSYTPCVARVRLYVDVEYRIKLNNGMKTVFQNIVAGIIEKGLRKVRSFTEIILV